MMNGMRVYELHGFPFEGLKKDDKELIEMSKRTHCVYCIDGFLNNEQATLLWESLRMEIPQTSLKRHGSRKHALFFDVNSNLKKQYYRYGQRDWKMDQGMPKFLQETILTPIANAYGLEFNGIVYNLYSSPKSEIWWHTDLQPGIGNIVSTVSFGRSADLEFRVMKKPVSHEVTYDEELDYHGEEVVLRVPCHHGTLIIMGQGVNHFYQHRVPPSTESQCEQAMLTHGSFERASLTLHYHFDNKSSSSHVNIINKNNPIINVFE